MLRNQPWLHHHRHIKVNLTKLTKNRRSEIDSPIKRERSGNAKIWYSIAFALHQTSKEGFSSTNSQAWQGESS